MRALPYKLLVVDDDPWFLEMMGHLLDQEGYQVELCPTSETAYERARDFRPDVVTLDLRMPGASGWDVLQAIKADPALSPVPVLLISAAGSELADTTERLRELHYPRVDAIAKPFEIDELLSRLADAALSFREPAES